jgi:hypothetical protein
MTEFDRKALLPLLSGAAGAHGLRRSVLGMNVEGDISARR